MKVTYEDFMNFVRSLEGKTLYTMSRQKAFTVSLEKDALIITPASTGIKRKYTKAGIDKVNERFNDIGSFSPTDYHDITYMGSYHLTILKTMQEKYL